jgi:hypothetical protein
MAARKKAPTKGTTRSPAKKEARKQGRKAGAASRGKPGASASARAKQGTKRAGKTGKRPGARRPARPGNVPRHVPHNARPAIRQRAGLMEFKPLDLPEDKAGEAAAQEHQDPRGTDAGVGSSGAAVRPENYGQFKNKAPARNDKPVNWFRRAAKPPQ